MFNKSTSEQEKFFYTTFVKKDFVKVSRQEKIIENVFKLLENEHYLIKILQQFKARQFERRYL